MAIPSFPHSSPDAHLHVAFCPSGEGDQCERERVTQSADRTRTLATTGHGSGHWTGATAVGVNLPVSSSDGDDNDGHFAGAFSHRSIPIDKDKGNR